MNFKKFTTLSALTLRWLQHDDHAPKLVGLPPLRHAPTHAMDCPPYLYKYRRFSTHLLEDLCDSAWYYASPGSFNDPLDSKPRISGELAARELAFLLEKMRAGSGPGHPAQLGRIQRGRPLRGGGDPCSAVDEIERLLQKEVAARGVFCMAKRWDCPLMWSHYADQHEGVCIEYPTVENRPRALLRVNYGGDRAITLSDLYRWKVLGEVGTGRSIVHRALQQKAGAWAYEQEWRHVKSHTGRCYAPWHIASVYFGARCSLSVRTAIVKLLWDMGQKIQFYDVEFDRQTFTLKKHSVDVDEVLECGMSPSPAAIFGSEGERRPLPLGVVDKRPPKLTEDF